MHWLSEEFPTRYGLSLTNYFLTIHGVCSMLPPDKFIIATEEHGKNFTTFTIQMRISLDEHKQAYSTRHVRKH